MLEQTRQQSMMASRNVRCFLRLINCKPEPVLSSQQLVSYKLNTHTAFLLSLWISGSFMIMMILPSIKTHLAPFLMFILCDYLDQST